MSFRVFSNVVLAGNDEVMGSVHQTDHANALKEERSIKDEMEMLWVGVVLLRRKSCQCCRDNCS